MSAFDGQMMVPSYVVYMIQNGSTILRGGSIIVAVSAALLYSRSSQHKGVCRTFIWLMVKVYDST